MIWGEFIALVTAGLACGFVDSSLGMGYGVTPAMRAHKRYTIDSQKSI